MKAVDQLMARLGGNMAESMGPATGAPLTPTPALLHGGAERYKGAARIKDALAIKLEQIIPDPNQPRKEFDPVALDELAASLKARGQLQPVRVRWDEGASRWILISGERRYRAALLAGLPTLTCIEATRPLTEEDLLEDQLVENCLRQDLKPIEQARVTSGELAPSVAYEVSRLDDPEQQREVAARVVVEGLNRSEAVEAIRQATGKPKGKAAGAKGRGGKPRKVVERVLRTTAGPRVTVEFKRGLDAALIAAALSEALDQVKAEMAADQAAA